MFYEENDTINANEQQAQQVTTDAKKGMSNESKKIAAGTVAGAALGSAAVFGANAIHSDEPANHPAEHTDEHPEKQEPTTAPKPEPKPEEKPAKDPSNSDKDKKVDDKKVDDKTPEEKEEAPFMKENKVEIEKIETRELDGSNVHVASGTVNGHAAFMVDDGQGNMVNAVVDLNDNGHLDEGENISLSEQKITLSDVATKMTAENTHDVAEQEVHVVSVVSNVEMDGHTVNVAAVTINDEPVIFIDSNQNGEVDVAIGDTNNNGCITDDEPVNVAPRHIPMPTEDDVEEGMGMAANDGMPDYSNDSDTTTFEA